MRKRFERQIDLGQTPIEEVELPLQSRDELPPILAGLQWIFTTQHVSEEIFTLLEKKVTGDKKETGRQGMDLWHILVLGVVRLGLGCDYDRMEHLANYDMLIRQIMGLKTDLWQQGHENFHGKTINENICHIDEELLKEINAIVMSHGRKLFKRTGEKVAIKLDSYVLESNVHFPTDYNLLWDCNRKCIELLSKLKAQLCLNGWRKEKVWLRQLKNQMRAIGRVSHRGGANKEKRLKMAATVYLDKSRKLGEKVEADLKELKRFCVSEASLRAIVEIEYYYKWQQHQMDLLFRRIIKGETIPTEEKIHSVFEAHTEWINKGKGTDQNKLIIDSEHLTSAELARISFYRSGANQCRDI
jgi:IS5 family transposase